MCDVQNEFKEKSPDLGTIEGNKIKTSSVYYIVGTYVWIDGGYRVIRPTNAPPNHCVMRGSGLPEIKSGSS